MVESLNRQRVLNFLDVFYSGDTEGALARCSDDIEFFSNAPIDILPHMGHHRGKDDVRRMWQTVRSRYSEMRYDLPIIVTEADKVAANIRVYFRWPRRAVRHRRVLRAARQPHHAHPRDHGYVRPGAAGTRVRHHDNPDRPQRVTVPHDTRA